MLVYKCFLLFSAHLEAHKITRKQARSCAFCVQKLHQNTCFLVFSPFSAYFNPQWIKVYRSELAIIIKRDPQ